MQANASYIGYLNCAPAQYRFGMYFYKPFNLPLCTDNGSFILVLGRAMYCWFVFNLPTTELC